MATEKRLIDAKDWDSFYADMGDSRNTMDSYDMGYTDALDRVDDWMDAQPTVDAVEVVHGRWRFCGSDRWNDAYECSMCGKMAMDNSNYCPNCGAKMEGGVQTDG